MIKLFSILFFSLFVVPIFSASRPIVIWHGMGDTCCFSFSMGAVKDRIQSVLPGTYVYSVMIGSNIISDEIQGFISNANEQVDFVCQTILSDPNLKNGFNAVGFSQGSQFLRAVVERCSGIKVYNLISMGGQHQGVADIPNCVTPNSTICSTVEYLLSFGAYNSLIQDIVIQAQYFKDPLAYDDYLAVNQFIADINNEKTTKNSTYKQNLIKLNNFVLFEFTEDTVVVPKESSWFGYYPPGDLSTIVPIDQQPIYTEDWIGLKTLDQTNRLIFGKCPGDHMQFTLDWFQENVITPYLNNTI